MQLLCLQSCTIPERAVLLYHLAVADQESWGSLTSTPQSSAAVRFDLTSCFGLDLPFWCSLLVLSSTLLLVWLSSLQCYDVCATAGVCDPMLAVLLPAALLVHTSRLALTWKLGVACTVYAMPVSCVLYLERSIHKLCRQYCSRAH